MEKIKKFSRFAIPAILLVMPLLVMADVGLPSGVPGGTELTLTKIEDIITIIANWLIIIGIIIAVIYIVYGGIRYMTAGGDSAAATKAKDAIKNGIIGAVIVLGVGVILRTAAALVTRTFFGAGQ